MRAPDTLVTVNNTNFSLAFVSVQTAYVVLIYLSTQSICDLIKIWFTRTVNQNTILTLILNQSQTIVSKWLILSFLGAAKSLNRLEFNRRYSDSIISQSIDGAVCKINPPHCCGGSWCSYA